VSARRARLSAVLVIAAALALATWQLNVPWWAWPVYGVLIGWLLTFALRADGSEER
jgi:uncharacterized membrane protein YbaN (DUF454 family)